MKIVLISVYPPFAAPEANHALHLSEHLADAGVEVHVLCQKGAVPATHTKITTYPVMENWSFSESGKLKKVLRSVNPDAVFLVYLGWIYQHSVMMTALPTIVGRMGLDAPFICQIETLEGAKIQQPFYHAILRRIASLVTRGNFHIRYGSLLDKSDLIITLSEPHKNQLSNIVPSIHEKAVVIPPPPLIRLSSASPASARRIIRKKFSIRASEFVFVFWGHIYSGKGLDSLLIAFEQLHRKEPNSRLLIAGGHLYVSQSPEKDEAYYHFVRRLPEKLGISNAVTWAGPFEWDSESGSEYLLASDACVLPIDWGVTLNNSTLAAAASHELPIIATKGEIGIDAALVHGSNIYLCPPGDTSAMADAMEKVLNVNDFRKMLARGAGKLADEWHSWPSVAKKIIGQLEIAIERKQKKNTLEEPHRRNRSQPKYKELPAKPKKLRRKSKSRKPLVSVILAVYNIEKYLAQCVDSLVHQTLADIEILAIDDKSTDNSRAILLQYAKIHSNLRVIGLTSNVGLASVRNIGLKEAKGEYITFLDGDDWADIRMCEILYNRARSLDADVVSASATVFYVDNKNFAPLFDDFTRQQISAFAKTHCFSLDEEPLAMQLEMVAWTKIYNAEFLRKNELNFLEGFNSYEDVHFHIKCMIMAEKITVIDDPVVFYRQNRTGQISGDTGKTKFQIFDIFQEVNSTLKEWNVSDVIWGQVIRTELRHLDWMYSERVLPGEKKLFMRKIAKCLGEIPSHGWRTSRYRGIRDAAKSVAMQRGWQWAYELTKIDSTIPSRLLVLTSMTAILHGDIFEPEWGPIDRSRLPKIPDISPGEDNRYRPPVVQPKRKPKRSKIIGPFPVGTHKILDQEILLIEPGKLSHLGNAIWRVENDHFLTRLCVFRENDIVVDIGAHMGLGAIYLAKKFPFLKIFAVEPDARKFKLMEKNIEINNIDNITVKNAAICDKNGKSRLYRNLSNEDWSTLDPKSAKLKQNFSIQDVETFTCARLFKKFGITECRMLKIEAWGSVKGILDTLPSTVSVDHLCGEVHLEDCSEASLLAASLKNARQHFWHAWKMTNFGQEWSTLQRLPMGPWKKR